MIATSIVQQPQPGCLFRKIEEPDRYAVHLWAGGALWLTHMRMPPGGMPGDALHDVSALLRLRERMPDAFALMHPAASST